jgi:hypothetical protein
MTNDELLARDASPGVFTAVGPYAEQVDALPDDIAGLAHAVQMLLVHRGWAQAYGLTLTAEREKENGLHSTEAMLDRAMQLAPAKIGEVRLPDRRVVGICRHFSTMFAAFLKHKGIPARARCGFATYFQKDRYVDHWVTEYWHAQDARWVLVDAQLDELQQRVTKADFDPLDTPRDRFLVAGDVWQQYRAGKITGEQCGIADMWGAWYIVGNHALDVASLQNVELLPWEPFGMFDITGKPPPTPEAARAQESLVDRTAALTTKADATAITNLVALAEQDSRLRPPQTTIDAAIAADAAGTGTGANPLSTR